MVGQFGPVPLEERGLFRHKISRVIHVCDSKEGLAFMCQRKVQKDSDGSLNLLIVKNASFFL